VNNIVKGRSVIFNETEFIGRRRDNGGGDIQAGKQKQRKAGKK